MLCRFSHFDPVELHLGDIAAARAGDLEAAERAAVDELLRCDLAPARYSTGKRSGNIRPVLAIIGTPDDGVVHAVNMTAAWIEPELAGLHSHVLTEVDGIVAVAVVQIAKSLGVTIK